MLGGELLPETRPSAIGRFATFGITGSAKYGFTNGFGLQLKTWWATSKLDGSIRTGYAGSVIVMLNNSTNAIRLALLPTFAFLFGGTSNDGQGFGIPIVAWLPPVDKLHLYLGLGPAIGWQSLANGIDGFGLIGNVGAAYQFADAFDLTGELSALLVRNRYDAVTTFMVSPKLSLGWLF